MAQVKPLKVTLFIDGEEIESHEIPLTKQERDFIDLCTMSEDTMNKFKIETFYTGGGFYITEASYLGQYAVITSVFKNCLAAYNYIDDEHKYTMETVVLSATYEELPPILQKLYKKMFKHMDKEIRK